MITLNNSQRRDSRLKEYIKQQGYSFEKKDGVLVSSDDTAVQAIIDSYDPLPEAKAYAIELINEAAGNARVKYGTNIPFQDATYQMKEKDARAYKTAGYPVDVSPFPFVGMESQATGKTAQEIADMVIALADQWTLLASGIEGLRQGGITAVNNATDWQNCEAIAGGYVAQLEAL